MAVAEAPGADPPMAIPLLCLEHRTGSPPRAVPEQNLAASEWARLPAAALERVELESVGWNQAEQELADWNHVERESAGVGWSAAESAAKQAQIRRR